MGFPGAKALAIFAQFAEFRPRPLSAHRAEHASGPHGVDRARTSQSVAALSPAARPRSGRRAGPAMRGMEAIRNIRTIRRIQAAAHFCEYCEYCEPVRVSGADGWLRAPIPRIILPRGSGGVGRRCPGITGVPAAPTARHPTMIDPVRRSHCGMAGPEAIRNIRRIRRIEPPTPFCEYCEYCEGVRPEGSAGRPGTTARRVGRWPDGFAPSRPRVGPAPPIAR